MKDFSESYDQTDQVKIQIMERFHEISRLLRLPYSNYEHDPFTNRNQMSADHKQAYVPSSLYRGQGRVLAILALKPEIEQRYLGYMLGMSKQALGELIAKLERSGYVTREPHPEDRRRMVVHLTQAGQQQAEKLREQNPDYAGIFDALDSEELTELNRLLGKLAASLEEHLPEYRERLKQRRHTIAALMHNRHHACNRAPIDYFQHHRRSMGQESWN